MVDVLPQVDKFRRMALDLLFPQWCLGCGKEGALVCSSCQNRLPRIMPPVCPLCGRPQSSGILCPGCTGWQAEIEGIRSPFRFEELVRQIIYRLKYKNLRALVHPLALLLQDYMQKNPVPGEVLVPVPLHKKRLRERGYNQSELLARELGKLTGLPVVDDGLVRQQYALPQARTSNLDERQSNVAGVFICRDERLRDQQVILIDDVSTSGATLNACAGALKSSGVVSVWGLVLAREI